MNEENKNEKELSKEKLDEVSGGYARPDSNFLRGGGLGCNIDIAPFIKPVPCPPLNKNLNTDIGGNKS